MKLYLRLTSDATGEMGEVTLDDLGKLVTAARRQGCPRKGGNVIGEPRDQLHRFYVPAIEWTEQVDA